MMNKVVYFINTVAVSMIMTVAIAAGVWPSWFGFHQAKLPAKLVK